MSEKMQVQDVTGTTGKQFVWRFFSGQHLDGWERMNTSWLRRGTEPAHKSNWWNRKARLERAAWRDGITLGLGASVYGWWQARTLTVVMVILFVIYVIAKVTINVHWKIFRPIRIGLGDDVWREKMVHPKLTKVWQRWLDFWARPEKIASDNTVPIPPDVLKALQAENAEDGGAPIISAKIVTDKRLK